MDLNINLLDSLSVSPVSLAVALTTLLISVVYFVLQRKDLPPGPRGLPFLGIWPFLDDQTCHFKLDKMKQRYGDVFCFTCAGTLYINLGTIKAVREAHITKADCFSDRMSGFTLMQNLFEHGVLYDTGESWKVQRKFFQQVMRERGVKAITDSLSGSLLDVVNDTVTEIRGEKGEPTNIIGILTNKCTSTLRITLFGEEGLSDQTVRKLSEEYEIMVAGMTPINTMLVGNFARYFMLPFYKSYRSAKKSKTQMFNILSDAVEEHKRTYSEDHIRDIIDDFIKERNDRRKKSDPTVKYFTDKALVGSLVQFVGDGVLAVSFFISVMIKSLIEHPEDQDRIYQEILEVVGPDRLPSIEDKPKLSYLNAFTLEVIRMSDFFPIFAALECKKETTLQGYRIPKGAITLMNLWSSHYDPTTYEEPHKFNPSRFMSKDGNKRADLPITFGVGKRACIGEGFVMTQIFLFLSAIIKNFHLTIPEMKPDDKNTLLFDLLVSGKLQICAKPRSSK